MRQGILPYRIFFYTIIIYYNSGLDKAEILLALYNGSHSQGLSWLELPNARITIDDCEAAAWDFRYFVPYYWQTKLYILNIDKMKYSYTIFERKYEYGTDSIQEWQTHRTLFYG